MDRTIESAIYREYWRQSRVCMPCYTPPNWFENDLFRITKDGFWVEYEIKRSLSDFRADARKSRWLKIDGLGDVRNKHELLSNNPDVGPASFYFVVPTGLAVDLPAWAGLVIASQGRYGWSVKVEKRAPRRHSRPAPDAWVDAIFRTAYFRLGDRLCSQGMGSVFESGDGI